MLVLTALAGGVALASPAHAQWLSPGPLASDHKDLDDAASCEKCHAPGKRVEQARCLSCHKEVAAPLAANRGFHAKLIREAGKGCEHCHSEHKGRGYPLIRWSPPADFDHGKQTGFPLSGAHATAGCGTCHDHRPGYQGARNTCSGCHEDVHQGELGARCERCHDTVAFKPPKLFDHATTDFPLENKHREVACASCHKREATGKVSYQLKGFQKCSTCHGDPHRGATSLSPCTDCHTTAGWGDVKNLPPAHSPAGWPLVGKHAPVACADCHGANLTAKVERSCATCHEDAHAGRFGKRCESCHNESGWHNIRTAGFDHGKTRYPLEGEHRTVRCEQCHRRGGKTVYKGIAFDRCDRCHKPYHQGALATVKSATECEACHTVQGFDPSTFTTAEHQKARMVLDGSHLAAPCSGCHVKKKSQPTPLAIGVKPCSGCHEDPHKGQFNAQMKEAGKSCDACHDSAGWKQRDFDHDQTAFPLRGVHADAACESCHKGDPIQYKGLPKTCEGCHRDPHLAQFTSDKPAVKACTACHTEQTWKQQPFDHTAKADWPLEGHHAAQICSACHDSRAVATGEVVVHYRLGYRACQDCHANPHRSVAAKATALKPPGVPDIGGDCASCHNPKDWHQVPEKTQFDHKLTGFPLDGRHAVVSCTACHGEALKTGDARAACESCHEDIHRGENGKSCESCHDARSWRPTDALVKHRATRFPLVGAHAAADCTACHQTLRQDTWRSTPTECYACHAKDFQRGDVHPNHVAANFSRECDACHSQYSFTPARLQHDVFFPLRGAHAIADCFACHEGGVYGGTPKSCYSCHADAYNGAVDPPHAAYAMSRQCDQCHASQSWIPTKSRWHDHLFPISSGHHARFDCGDCHFANAVPPANFTCIGCHEKGPTTSHHGGVSDYVWENFACYGCHPGG
ncbi:MAG: hypothetical protein CVU56_10770 [Deltaproteobacteria bacterium HGW-Deltaproteobacteria-14]|jgi:hypothetical protein|nr:MAG: hypothetical protein CVU56_10770 [Deltaproteobacteria bacterium HGW-Deltaproteobacteria-14]